MRSLPEKLSTAAFALVLGVEGCAPPSAPKQPEVIVEIPPVISENPRPDRHITREAKIEKEEPLTIKRILSEVPALRSAEEIDDDIERYKSSLREHCARTRESVECSALLWNQHERILSARDEDTAMFHECDQAADDDSWALCVRGKLDTDDDYRTIRAYCSHVLLRCIIQK